MVAFKSLVLVIILAMLAQACNTAQMARMPNYDDCLRLGKSTYCYDVRLDNDRIAKIIQNINARENLTNDQKTELVNYFTTKSAEIIKEQGYTIQDRNIGFFKGYSMTSPADRKSLETFAAKEAKTAQENVNLLKRYKRECGDLGQ